MTIQPGSAVMIRASWFAAIGTRLPRLALLPTGPHAPPWVAESAVKGGHECFSLVTRTLGHWASDGGVPLGETSRRRPGHSDTVVRHRSSGSHGRYLPL